MLSPPMSVQHNTNLGTLPGLAAGADPTRCFLGLVDVKVKLRHVAARGRVAARRGPCHVRGMMRSLSHMRGARGAFLVRARAGDREMPGLLLRPRNPPQT